MSVASSRYMNVICTYEYIYYKRRVAGKTASIQINVTLLLRTEIATCIVCCSEIGIQRERYIVRTTSARQHKPPRLPACVTYFQTFTSTERISFGLDEATVN